jgi:threonine 3-dehydrogenase
MNNKMQGFFKTSQGYGGSLQEVEIPVINDDEVLVKVQAAAICGTDLHVYEWNSWAQDANITVPRIMGHEFSGVVAKIGKNIKELKVGDYVASETHIPCGLCHQCKIGNQHICGNLKLFSIHTDGCFAEYTKAPEIALVKIPKTISSSTGAILEPLGTALRSVIEGDVTGKTIVVLGCGPIGLYAIASSQALGAARIIAVDIAEERLKIASIVGADVIINPLTTAQYIDLIKELTFGVGVSTIIDASGSPKGISEGFKYLKKGGYYIMVGLPSEPVSLNLGPDVVFKEAVIKGIHGRKMFETWDIMLSLLEAGKLNIDPIITHHMPLKDAQKGFQLLQTGQACKIILNP